MTAKKGVSAVFVHENENRTLDGRSLKNRISIAPAIHSIFKLGTDEPSI